MEPPRKLHAGLQRGTRQRLRIHVRTIEEAALAFVAGEYDAPIRFPSFACGGVLWACVLPCTQGR